MVIMGVFEVKEFESVAKIETSSFLDSSGPYFNIKFGHNSRRVGRTESATSTSSFYSNFT